MKLLVIHDQCGNFKSVAVAPGAIGLSAGLRAQYGELVTQVETDLLGLEDMRRNPSSIKERFRLDTDRAALIRKET